MSTVGFKMSYFKGSNFGVGRNINQIKKNICFVKLTSYQHHCHCAKDMIQRVYIESFISLLEGFCYNINMTH